MKNIFTNTPLVILAVTLFSLFSLILSIIKIDVEWFQASGAVVTIGGVILAARKMIRKGIEEFMRDEQIMDLGNIIRTPEEIESKKQLEKDMNAYRYSIPLLIVGTLLWAYGGILLRLCGIGA